LVGGARVILKLLSWETRYQVKQNVMSSEAETSRVLMPDGIVMSSSARHLGADVEVQRAE
jgi:hypothetical protein